MAYKGMCLTSPSNSFSLFQELYEPSSSGFNPRLLFLVFVVGVLLIFFIGNYVLYSYAQKVSPPKKKKILSRKKQAKMARKTTIVQ